jgi:hypothetical protein
VGGYADMSVVVYADLCEGVNVCQRSCACERVGAFVCERGYLLVCGCVCASG